MLLRSEAARRAQRVFGLPGRVHSWNAGERAKRASLVTAKIPYQLLLSASLRFASLGAAGSHDQHVVSREEQQQRWDATRDENQRGDEAKECEGASEASEPCDSKDSLPTLALRFASLRFARCSWFP